MVAHGPQQSAQVVQRIDAVRLNREQGFEFAFSRLRLTADAQRIGQVDACAAVRCVAVESVLEAASRFCELSLAQQRKPKVVARLIVIRLQQQRAP